MSINFSGSVQINVYENSALLNVKVTSVVQKMLNNLEMLRVKKIVLNMLLNKETFYM